MIIEHVHRPFVGLVWIRHDALRILGLHLLLLRWVIHKRIYWLMLIFVTRLIPALLARSLILI